MVNPKLYESSGTYDFFMKLLGYERSIERFLTDLELDGAPPRRILDAGCGTGLLGLHFLERCPEAQLVATDLERNFLHATLANADRRGLDRRRIEVGVADITTPANVTSREGTQRALLDSSFDLVCVGAVVGYAEDVEASLRRLIQLVAPGGCFLNLEMNESPTGRYVSHRYRYHNLSLERMRQVLGEAGCTVSTRKLKLKHLPAKLTRICLLARKENGA